MKVIKSKPHKAPETIDSLMKPKATPQKDAASPVDRVLVVYREDDASIYYEPPAPPRHAARS